MNEAPQFAQPHHLGSARQGSQRFSNLDGGSTTVSYGLDDNMFVEFYPENVHMEYLSKVSGQQIFQERIFTRIIAPGNRLTVVVHQTKGITYETVQDPETGEYHTNWEVQEQQENGDQVEPEKYPNAWRRFLKVGISADNGHPIEQWGAVTRSYAASMKAQNIHTVEALASLSDQMAQQIMGAVKYRDLARAHLDDSKRLQIVAQEQERANKFQEQAQLQAKQLETLQAEVMRLQHMLASGGNNNQAMSDSRLTGGIINEQISTMNRQRETEGTHGVGGVKKMSRQDANKKHQIPAGKPGEAA